jgi:serine/threonine protein kinase
MSVPRSPRPKTTDPVIAESLIKHYQDQWRDLKTGNSPRNKIVTNFEIGQPIGKGGSGAKVYQCRLDDGAMYAVKCMTTKEMVPADVDRVRKEREIMEQIPFHRNLIHYRGHYETDEEIYIFMSLHNSSLYEYLKEIDQRCEHFNEMLKKGEPPKALNKRCIYLSLNDVIRFSIDILTGLVMLHECCIIHRDLKSANVFVNYGPDNNVSYLTLGDFDSAKKIVGVDGTKTCVGTPLWIAPEIIGYGDTKAISYGFPADIWSFGMVLYEMMSCKLPFYEIKGPMAHLHRVLDGKLPTLTDEQQLRYAPILEHWNQCLDLDPTKRPTADNLLTVFKKILQ